MSRLPFLWFWFKSLWIKTKPAPVRFPDLPSFEPTMPMDEKTFERYHAEKDQLEQVERQKRIDRINARAPAYAEQLREFERLALEADDHAPTIAEINQAVLDLTNHDYEVSWGPLRYVRHKNS